MNSRQKWHKYQKPICRNRRYVPAFRASIVFASLRKSIQLSAITSSYNDWDDSSMAVSTGIFTRYFATGAVEVAGWVYLATELLKPQDDEQDFEDESI